MEHYDIFYWLGILGGNICYIIMLLAVGRAMKSSGIKKAGYMALTALMLAGFILLNPWSKEIKLPGIVTGDYGMFSREAKAALGIVCVIIPYMFMWCYRFFAFTLQQYHNKNKDTSVFYVYHTIFVLFHAGVWNIWMIISMFFASAVVRYYKTSWEGIFGMLLAAVYAGGIGMMLLRQKTFEIKDGYFQYNGMRKKYRGLLADIEAVEKTEKGVAVYVKGEKLDIRCHLEELTDLFSEKIKYFMEQKDSE